MEIRFVDSKLEDLYHTGGAKGYHPDIVKLFIRRVNFLRKASMMDDVYAMKSLHCEKLTGDRQGQMSVRLNQGRRLIFRLDKEGQLYVVAILELSNHYG